MPIPMHDQWSHLGISLGAIVLTTVYMCVTLEILGRTGKPAAFALLYIHTLLDTLASVIILPAPPIDLVLMWSLTTNICI